MKQNVITLNTRPLTEESENFITSLEAAEFLGISTKRLMNLTSSGNIPYYKLGRSNRYLKSQLKLLLASNSRGLTID